MDLPARYEYSAQARTSAFPLESSAPECRYLANPASPLSSDAGIEHLWQGLQACASWLMDWSMYGGTHQRSTIQIGIRSSSRQFKHFVKWSSAVLTMSAQVYDLNLFDDELFVNMYLAIFWCAEMVQTLIDRRGSGFVLRSKAMSPLMEIHSRIKQIQKLRSTVQRSTLVKTQHARRCLQRDDPMVSQSYDDNTKVESTADCEEFDGPKAAKSPPHHRPNRMRNHQTATSIANSKIPIDIISPKEWEVNSHLTSRVARLQASRALFKADATLRSILQGWRGTMLADVIEVEASVSHDPILESPFWVN